MQHSFKNINSNDSILNLKNFYKYLIINISLIIKLKYGSNISVVKVKDHPFLPANYLSQKYGLPNIQYANSIGNIIPHSMIKILRHSPFEI